MARLRPSTAPQRQPVVWVTGASKGIGRAIAKAFATTGCTVCVSARSASGLTSLVREIAGTAGRAAAFPCDISRSGNVERTLRRIERLHGPVDVLVNNAGITVFKSFLATSLQEFDAIIDTNLKGSIACLKAVVPGMVRRRRGWVINVLSTASAQTFPGSAAYTASKAGLFGLADVLREEVRSRNIRVVNVLPGPTVTAMWSRSDRRKFSRRMMSPKSVAEAILELYLLPTDVVAEQVVLRPVRGDIA